MDLSVKASDRTSRGCRIGVKERVWRSRSVPSLVCVRAEDASNSSVFCRPDAIPAQSPEIGRALGCSGDSERGVRAPCISVRPT